ncbi:MAG: sulfite exporter TauE/SafE family protein, partial [Micromonosporaceae bacterium]
SVNALAGGGSLITYPSLLAIGLPPVTANVSNAVSVCPGYIASVAGSRKDLKGQHRQLYELIPTAVVGTCAGAAVLLLTPARAFELVVPFLIIGASGTLALQGRIRMMVGHPHQMSATRQRVSLHVLVLAGAAYGGYFTAALGVMLVAVLSLVLPESMARISAVKNALSAIIGLICAAVFTFFGPVNWVAVLALTPATFAGGYLGALGARRIPSAMLRWIIVAYGLAVGGYLLVRTLT